MMKFLNYSIFIFILTAIKDVQSEEKACKTAVSDMLKYQMQSITKCTKELGFKGKEKTEKMNCIMKCVLIASGAIKPDGKVEIESALGFVLEYIPVEFLEKALKGSMKCQRFMDSLDPNEPTCKSYEPLVKCLTGFIMSLCSK
ncbi:uncharacterized protein LOC110842098 [Folsomia candida]|uniref:uncharacterized protein LOC110842098 n=1 Tax=Folsomia candida TaxID=158441 RepID=UPI000B906D3C|nr:uncharacterized protein LOC110842098 [Folsomia candida]